MNRRPEDLFGALAGEVRARLDVAATLARRLGLDLYLVGGAVRDLLLGEELRDLDLVWEGARDPRRVVEAFGEAFESEATYHPEFLTASLTVSTGLRIDIGRARAETYPEAAALPLVRVSGLTEDLERRDFSVNAMAVSLTAPGHLIDPCRGAADLESRQLRVLHEGSFRDDPTRILRGCELAVRRDLAFEPVTSRLITAAVDAGYLALLSGTRVRHELARLLGAPGRAAAGASRLRELRVDRALHPGLRIDSEGLTRLGRLRGWHMTAGESRENAGAGFWIVALCALLWHRPQEVRSGLANWLHLTRGDRPWLESVPERLMPLLDPEAPVESSSEEMANLVSGLSADEARLAELLAGVASLARLRELGELSQVELGISGAELIAAGVSPGPRVGEALAATLAARRRREISADGERAFALAWVARGGEEDAR